MPYASRRVLPAAVRRVLPQHACEIYRKAFNNAWRQYASRNDREALAHRVAWAAVKRVYRKMGDRWIRQRRRPAQRMTGGQA